MFHEAIPNTAPFGPPLIEAVPSNLRIIDDRILVAVFGGFPFPSGAGEIRQIGPRGLDESVLIGGLTTPIDVLSVGEGTSRTLYVLEFSADLLSQAPGRLLRFTSPGSTPHVVASGLITPTGMDYHAPSETLYLSELATGRLLAVDLSR